MQNNRNKKVVFLTGATGFIGRNLLYKMIDEDSDSKFLLLIRAETQEKAVLRISDIIKEKYPDTYEEILDERIHVFCGNLSREYLGFSSNDYSKIARSVTHIIHCAANVNFNNTLDNARKINFNGTKQVIDLGKEANKSENLKCFAHISTAYVSGSNEGLIFENEEINPSQFSNSYEQSKYETENFIKLYMDKLPLIILKPSIVIGDSKTGKTCSFNVLYNPLNMIHKGYLKYIPGKKNCFIDIVPIDFVTDASYHIIFHANKEDNRIFHLTSGKRNSPKVGDLVKHAITFFNENKNIKSSVKFFSPQIIKFIRRYLPKKALRMLRLMEMYTPYVSKSRIFDNSNTLKALENTGIKLPEFDQYFDRILNYCLITNWGKN